MGPPPEQQLGGHPPSGDVRRPDARARRAAVRGGEVSCSARGNITKIYRWRPDLDARGGLCGGRHFELLLLTDYLATHGRGIFVDLGAARCLLLTNGVMATLAKLSSS